MSETCKEGSMDRGLHFLTPPPPPHFMNKPTQVHNMYIEIAQIEGHFIPKRKTFLQLRKCIEQIPPSSNPFLVINKPILSKLVKMYQVLHSCRNWLNFTLIQTYQHIPHHFINRHHSNSSICTNCLSHAEDNAVTDIIFISSKMYQVHILR